MDAVAVLQAGFRAVHVAALLSLFGVLVFRCLVGPTGGRLAPASVVVALVAGAGWLFVQAAVIAGADDFAAAWSALPVVVARTQFGHWLLIRFLLLLAAWALSGTRRAGALAALPCAGAALAVQPMLGHAGAVGGSLGATLIASEALHLLAAGSWLGGLLPLYAAVRRWPPAAAVAACRGFTPVGLSAVLVLAGTATLQTVSFIGGLPGLLGTSYGQTALVKLGLFLVLLGLAAVNRLWLTGRLAGAGAAAARAHMRLSIVAEMLLGFAVVTVAAVLASSVPAAHEQPVWPLPWRPALDAFADPTQRGEVMGAGLALVAGVLAGAAALWLGWRWGAWRWPALAVAAVLLGLGVLHFSPLLVPAYPTTFFASPSDFATVSIVRGQRVFAAQCVACHGAGGRGDGPAAATLAVPPADLTAEHLWMHGDGDLYWYLQHGIDAPEGGLSMPGFGGVLSVDQRWSLIDYLRAHNAGESMRAQGVWPHPLTVPQFDARCADGRVIDLDDLRGRALRIVAAGAGAVVSATVVPAREGVATILLARGGGVVPDAASCVALEPATWTAFAILAGVADDQLSGIEMVADANHWLRARWLPGDEVDPQARLRQMQDIVAQPLPVDAGGPLAHRH